MIETTGYVSAVGIVVADTDRMYVGSMGHNILSKVLVECGNGRGIWRVNGGLSRLPEMSRRKTGRCGLFLAAAIQSLSIPRKHPPIGASLISPRE